MANFKGQMASASTQDAVLLLRKDPDCQELIRDAYLGEDVSESAERFYLSGEFAEITRLLKNISGKVVLDFGSGIGIAAAAFSRNGAGKVIALDPDLGDQIGLVAAKKLSTQWPFQPVAALGESIPFAGESFDIVYSRQVLHHAGNLPRMAEEIFRVLRSGGIFLSTRDHVVDNQRQLDRFLAEHPVHQLASGEHAFKLEEYQHAITSAGFELRRIFGPWDSVINAFPSVRSQSELEELPQLLLRQRFGPLGALCSRIPVVNALIWFYLRRRRKPGRMYSFLSIKPN